ncbi:MAG: helix-turn-helix domain-containing protein [Acidimicrobiales bacterium]
MTSTETGRRVAQFRRQRGLSQKDLASEVGRSVSWVSQVERGVQPVERLSVLRELADALGVALTDLRPEDLGGARPADDAVNDLEALRLRLSGHPALDHLFGQAAGTSDVGALAAEVDRAWELAHASRFAELDATLTNLLPKLEQASRGTRSRTQQSQLHALRARAYQSAAAAFARQDEPDAAWVSADRAISAAEAAGEPLEVIAGHFRLAHAFARLRQHGQADHVTTEAIDALKDRAEQPDAAPEVLSLYGAMHLVQAVISGQEGERRKAHRALQAAKRIAARLGDDRNDFDTEFGPTNVQLHEVAVAIDLGDAGAALEVAENVDASGLSPERQSRFLVDVARAHVQLHHIGEATKAILQAEQLAPEHVHSHHASLAVIEELLAQAGPRASTHLRDLAHRSGLAD